MKAAIVVLAICSALAVGIAVVSRNEKEPTENRRNPAWPTDAGGLMNDRTDFSSNSDGNREAIRDEFSSWFAALSEDRRRFIGGLSIEQKEWLRGLDRDDRNNALSRLMADSRREGLVNPANASSSVFMS